MDYFEYTAERDLHFSCKLYTFVKSNIIIVKNHPKKLLQKDGFHFESNCSKYII